jgi:PAS domain S-box-containing protein
LIGDRTVIRIVLIPIVLSIAILLLVGTVSFAIHAIAEIISRIREEKFSGNRRMDEMRYLYGLTHEKTLKKEVCPLTYRCQSPTGEGIPLGPFAELAELNRDMAMIITDVHGRITTLNKGTEALLGYGQQHVEDGLLIESLYTQDQLKVVADIYKATTGKEAGAFECLVADCCNGRVQEGEWTWMRSNETPVHVSLTTSSLKDEEGNLRGFLFMARKSLEKEHEDKSLMQPAEEQTAQKAPAAEESENQQDEVLQKV